MKMLELVKQFAYFPKVRNDKVVFEKNRAYQQEEIIIKKARDYPEFHIQKGIPIYTQYQTNPSLFNFVAQPQLASAIWETYQP